MAKKAAKVGQPKSVVVQPIRPLAINPFGPTEPRKITRSKVQDSEFILEDGTKIVVRPLLGDVRRAVDQYNENGEPLYFLTMGNTLATKAPKSLLKSNQAPKVKKAKKK
jgi:hypothetical protein